MKRQTTILKFPAIWLAILILSATPALWAQDSLSPTLSYHQDLNDNEIDSVVISSEKKKGLPLNLSKAYRNGESVFSFLPQSSDDLKYSRFVALGQWQQLEKSLYKDVPTERLQEVYEMLLQNIAENNKEVAAGDRLMTLDDLIALSDISPEPLNNKTLSYLISIGKDAIQAGYDVEPFINRLKKGSKYFGFKNYKQKKITSKLLGSLGLMKEVQNFLPTEKEAKAKKDFATVKLYTDILIRQIANKNQQMLIQRAWNLNQWLFYQQQPLSSFTSSVTNQSMQLYPFLLKKQRREWLAMMLQKKPHVLASSLTFFYKKSQKISSESKNINVVQQNLKTAQLILNDLESIKEVTPATHKKIAEVLPLLWMQEVKKTLIKFSRYQKLTSHEKRKYKLDFLMSSQLLKTAPDFNSIKKWMTPDLKNRFLRTYIYVLISTDHTDDALANIREYSKSSPKEALKFSETLLISWARSVNPNRIAFSSNSNRGTFGLIPLTSIRQKQNILQLRKYYQAILSMKIGDVRDSVLVDAFSLCHSTVEVYNRDEINTVFGPIDQLSPSRIQILCQNISKNLNNAWSDEKSQKDFRTGRSLQEIKQSLQGGYRLLISLLEDYLKKKEDYKTRLFLGNQYFAWAVFEKELSTKMTNLKIKTNFSKKIDSAFSCYEQSVQNYQKKLKAHPKTPLDVSPFTNWFEKLISFYEVPNGVKTINVDSWGFEKLRQLILSSPYPEKHMSLFGQYATSKLGASPNRKKVYVESSLIILKNYPAAKEIYKFERYYQELVKEIKLHAKLDNSSYRVGSHSFGVFVSIRHTDKISRECRGFYKFISPPNSRDRTDYRHEFIQNIKRALSSSFEVKSVTFVDSSVRPRPLIIHGKYKKEWSETPLAYLLLESKSPTVDSVPAFPIDLLFKDFKGSVSIPFYSNKLPIKSDENEVSKTPPDLKVYETLNERAQKPNTVSLEIRATAKGIIPPLHDLLKLQFNDFKILSENDEGIFVSKLIVDGNNTFPEVERNWTVLLSLPDYLPKKPTKFHFAEPKDPKIPVVYNRYVDADLAEVSPVIDFNAQKLKSSKSWVWWLLLIPLLGIVAWILFIKKTSTANESLVVSHYSIPSPLNAFTYTALLLSIRQDNVINDESLIKKLNADIREIEKSQFSLNTSKIPDLKSLAKKWIKHANQASRQTHPKK